MTGNHHRDSGCTGKVGFPTFSQAANVAATRVRDAGRVAYHCAHCGQFHIGRPTPGNRNKRLSRARRLADIREQEMGEDA